MKNPVGVFFVLCMALAPLASWSQSREAPDEGAEPSGEERMVLAIADRHDGHMTGRLVDPLDAG